MATHKPKKRKIIIINQNLASVVLDRMDNSLDESTAEAVMTNVVDQLLPVYTNVTQSDDVIVGNAAWIPVAALDDALINGGVSDEDLSSMWDDIAATL